jgi:hypothetical protein
MRRFAAELRDAGFEVDYRFAESMREGVQQHIDEFQSLDGRGWRRLDQAAIWLKASSGPAARMSFSTWSVPPMPGST